MLEEARTRQWKEDALKALVQHYGCNDDAAHLAAALLAVLTDRADLVRWADRTMSGAT
jgi:hypothetical protein